MSSLIAERELITTAATDLGNIGSTLSEANAAAATPTTGVLAAAEAEVSASIAQLFSQHAQYYQAQAAQAVAFHEQFVQHLTSGAGWYAAAEASNAALLQPLTASAGSFSSTIATLQGQILNLLMSANAALGQLLNSLRGFLHPLIVNALAFLMAFVTVFVLPTVRFLLNLLVVL